MKIHFFIYLCYIMLFSAQKTEKIRKYIVGVLHLFFFPEKKPYFFVSSNSINVCIVFFVRELLA